MSYLGYFITAKTKGGNPKVMFLSNSGQWIYQAKAPLVRGLATCEAYAKDEPTNCLLVEANEAMRSELRERAEIGGRLLCVDFEELIKKHNCHTVSTKKKKEKPAKTERRPLAQDTPIKQPQKRVGYVLYKEGSGGEKIYKCDTNIYAMVGGEAADVFRTEKEANFASYAFNTAYGANRWKVEQIEF